MAKLTDKQELFCLEYLKDLNATQAAMRAGYSKNTAYATGWENLRKPEIEKRLSELMQERCDSVKTDANYVLKRLREIDELDVIDIVKDDLSGFKHLKEWPKVWRTSISGMDIKRMMSGGEEPIESIIEKIKWPDKVKNLELIGRHVDVGAFAGEKQMDDTPIGRIEIEVVGANNND